MTASRARIKKKNHASAEEQFGCGTGKFSILEKNCSNQQGKEKQAQDQRMPKMLNPVVYAVHNILLPVCIS